MSGACVRALGTEGGGGGKGDQAVQLTFILTGAGDQIMPQHISTHSPDFKIFQRPCMLVHFLFSSNNGRCAVRCPHRAFVVVAKGPFKYYVSTEVGGWGHEIAIFADLQYYLC